MFSNHFYEKNEKGVIYLVSENIRARHAFASRVGGVSTGHLTSLNLGENRGDSRDNVLQNYALLSEATGIDTSRMAYTNQVHGNRVRVVTQGDARGHYEPLPYECDGIVTNTRGLPLICFAADCIPVILCDDENGVIGAVHCGWRSSVADILKNAIEEMCGLGADCRSISAAIGPAIGFCCFEVGAEVVEACEKYVGDSSGIVAAKENGKFYLDLKAANARRLVQLGLREENISVSQNCTMCENEKFFSHRFTNGNRGAQGSLIVL